jgi:LPS-assembly lipoprotein
LLPSRLIVFLLIGFLAGCGFKPMYAQTDNGAVANDLAAIKINLIADRRGQELRNYLLDRLTPRGQPKKPVYRLGVEVEERVSNIAVERTGLPTRANLRMEAEYTLVNAADGAALVSGSARVISSFNLLDSDFSTLTSRNDASSRALESIADQIRTRLSTYFAAHSAAASGG